MPRIRHLLPAAVLAAAALALPPVASAAPSIAYTNVASAPTGIAPGPDGNVWFGENGGLGRIGLDGRLAEFAGPSGTASVQGIAAGPDGDVWYAQWGASATNGGVGHVTVAGAAGALYRGGSMTTSGPTSILTGPDGNLWFTEQNSGEVGRVTPAGSVTHFSLGGGARPYGIAVGSDGNLWVTDTAGQKLWKVTPSGAATSYPLGFVPGGIETGPDGNLWIVGVTASTAGTIVKVDPRTRASVAYAPPAGVKPMNIATGPDGALWFASGYLSGATAGVGRVAVDGTVSFTPTTGQPLVVGDGPDGAVWFTDYGSNRVGRMTVQAPAVGAASVAPTVAGTASVAAQVKANGPGAVAVVEYGTTTAYGQRTATTAVPATATAGPVGFALTGLTPGASYHARLVVTNGAGATTGQDVAFTVPAAPGAPAPSVGRSVVGATVSGSVRVLVAGRWTALGGATTIPVGATFDTTRGTVALTSVKDAQGTLQTGRFRGGRFLVRQARSARPVTELVLAGRLACPAPGAGTTAHAAATREPKRLWGKDDHGRFRTRGRDSVATVRGTEWFTQESCAGTLTRVATGAVDVRDLHTGETVRVTAGHRYLARRAR